VRRRCDNSISVVFLTHQWSRNRRISYAIPWAVLSLPALGSPFDDARVREKQASPFAAAARKLFAFLQLFNLWRLHCGNHILRWRLRAHIAICHC